MQNSIKHSEINNSLLVINSKSKITFEQAELIINSLPNKIYVVEHINSDLLNKAAQENNRNIEILSKEDNLTQQCIDCIDIHSIEQVSLIAPDKTYYSKLRQELNLINKDFSFIDNDFKTIEIKNDNNNYINLFGKINHIETSTLKEKDYITVELISEYVKKTQYREVITHQELPSQIKDEDKVISDFALQELCFTFFNHPKTFSNLENVNYYIDHNSLFNNYKLGTLQTTKGPKQCILFEIPKTDNTFLYVPKNQLNDELELNFNIPKERDNHPKEQTYIINGNTAALKNITKIRDVYIEENKSLQTLQIDSNLKALIKTIEDSFSFYRSEKLKYPDYEPNINSKQDLLHDNIIRRSYFVKIEKDHFEQNRETRYLTESQTKNINVQEDDTKLEYNFFRLYGSKAKMFLKNNKISDFINCNGVINEKNQRIFFSFDKAKPINETFYIKKLTKKENSVEFELIPKTTNIIANDKPIKLYYHKFNDQLNKLKVGDEIHISGHSYSNKNDTILHTKEVPVITNKYKKEISK